MKDFLEAQISEATKRNYRFGLKTFAKWYKKPIQEILKEKDPGKTLEKMLLAYRNLENLR